MSTDNNNSDTFYRHDVEKGLLIPYRPDYSLAIPFTGSASRMRQATPKPDTNFGMVVPLNTTNYRSSSWIMIQNIAYKYPRVRIVAIVDPSYDGRGITALTGPDEEFKAAVANLVAAGISILGYINTDFADKSINDVKAEMDLWDRWFPELLSGFYFEYVNVNKVEYYKELDEYPKKTYSEWYNTNMIGLGSLIALPVLQSFCTNTNIDIIEIYGMSGYPTDQFYSSLKQEWMKYIPRSRFSLTCFDVSEDGLLCRNAIDRAVGVEKVAGYFYPITASSVSSHGTYELSSLAEIVMDHLSQIARESGAIASRGVVGSTTTNTTNTTMDDHLVAEAIKRYGTMTTTRAEENINATPPDMANKDPFGSKMMYAPIPGHSSILTTDPKHKDLNKDGSRRSSDKDGTTIIEFMSPKGKPFLNAEMTGYFRIVEMGKSKKERKGDIAPYLIQATLRCGCDPAKNNKGEGSGYKARILTTGEVCALKEIYHGAETRIRGLNLATQKDLTSGMWFGFKTVVYNYRVFDVDLNKTTDKLGVAIEIYLDDNCDDQGTLVVRNNWKHIATIRDEPGNRWGVEGGEQYNKKTKKGFDPKNKYPSLDDNSKEPYRQADEIITKPGGDKDHNCAVWSWTDIVVDYANLSVSEISMVNSD